MQFAHSAGKWAKIPGYNAFSPEIVQSRFSGPFNIHRGHQYRVWYGEDLVNYTESDNGGRVCADVWVLYVWSDQWPLITTESFQADNWFR